MPNSAEPVSPDQSITENDNQQEKTTVENSTEISEPVKDINKFDNDANVDKDETITVKKPTINVDTEKVEQGDETEKSKLEEIKKYIEDVAAKHPLGIAGIFHLFGKICSYCRKCRNRQIKCWQLRYYPRCH